MKLVNQLSEGVDGMPRIKRNATDVLKTLNLKLKSGDPLTIEKLFQISFETKGDAEETGEESKGEDGVVDEVKV